MENKRIAIEAIKLEMELEKILPEIDSMLIRIESYASCIASLYDNEEYEKEFVHEMQMKEADLLRLVNKLNDIAMRAMAINVKDIVFKCEDKKAKVVNIMETVRDLYM